MSNGWRGALVWGGDGTGTPTGQGTHSRCSRCPTFPLPLEASSKLPGCAPSRCCACAEPAAPSSLPVPSSDVIPHLSYASVETLLVEASEASPVRQAAERAAETFNKTLNQAGSMVSEVREGDRGWREGGAAWRRASAVRGRSCDVRSSIPALHQPLHQQG